MFVLFLFFPQDKQALHNGHQQDEDTLILQDILAEKGNVGLREPGQKKPVELQALQAKVVGFERWMQIFV